MKRLIAFIVLLAVGPVLAAPEAFLMWRPNTTSAYQRKVFTPVEDYVLSFDANGLPVIVPQTGGSGGTGVTSGDKGDITASVSGTVWTIDPDTITGLKIVDGTITNADISPGAGIDLSKLATNPLDRANHTGTQAASSISDFAASVRAQVEATLLAGGNVTLTPLGSGATRTLTIAATPGSGPGGSVPNTRIPYGDISGNLATEANLTYDASANMLQVDGSVNLSGTLFLGGNWTIDQPLPSHLRFSEDVNGDDLTLDLDTDNAARIYSNGGVNSLEFDGIDVRVPYEAYSSVGWANDTSVPTKKAVQEKIESMTAGTGDVTSDNAFGADNRLIRSDGTAKKVQPSGITVDDSNNVSGVNVFTTATHNTTNLNAADLRFDGATPDANYGHFTVTDPTAVRAWNLPNRAGNVAFEDATSAEAILASMTNGTTQGSVLVRGLTGWIVYGPGTSGQRLKTQGAGANPVWTDEVGVITVTVDGGSSVITTGSKKFAVMPCAGTVTGWAVSANTSGNISFDIEKAASNTNPTTSITGSVQPGLSSQQFLKSTTLTGWTTSLAADDVIEVLVVGTPATITQATLQVFYRKS